MKRFYVEQTLMEDSFPLKSRATRNFKILSIFNFDVWNQEKRKNIEESSAQSISRIKLHILIPLEMVISMSGLTRT